MRTQAGWMLGGVGATIGLGVVLGCSGGLGVPPSDAAVAGTQASILADNINTYIVAVAGPRTLYANSEYYNPPATEVPANSFALYAYNSRNLALITQAAVAADAPPTTLTVANVQKAITGQQSLPGFTFSTPPIPPTGVVFIDNDLGHPNPNQAITLTWFFPDGTTQVQQVPAAGTAAMIGAQQAQVQFNNETHCLTTLATPAGNQMASYDLWRIIQLGYDDGSGHKVGPCN